MDPFRSGGCDDGGVAQATPPSDGMTPALRMNANVSVRVFSRLQPQPTKVTEESEQTKLLL